MLLKLGTLISLWVLTYGIPGPSNFEGCLFVTFSMPLSTKVFIILINTHISAYGRSRTRLKQWTIGEPIPRYFWDRFSKISKNTSLMDLLLLVKYELRR